MMILPVMGGVVRVSSSLAETRGNVNFEAICRRASRRGEEMGFTAIMQREDVGDRIRGYTSATYNISGTVVCTVSDYRLRHPLHPSAGEHVIAIRSKTPNPRSNGLTDKRDAMVAMFGEDWHTKDAAKPFLEYLTSPSVILYPLFRRLTDSGVGKSVCHMSGHSFKKKLAGPFAKEELFVRLENIFPPDERDLAMARAIGSLPKSAARALPENLYAKWPMNHDGFVTTNNPEEAIKVIEEFGFEARDVGVLEEAKIINGKLKTGVELKDIKDSKGENIYFDGRN